MTLGNLLSTPWTAEEVATLRDMRAANAPDSAIAKQLGRSVESVRKKGKRLGVIGVAVPPKWPAWQPPGRLPVAGECMWCDGPRRGVTFCCAPVTVGSYCAEHARIAYKPREG